MGAMSDFTRLEQVHRALVNKSHGIITSLIEENNQNDAPGLFVFNGLTVEAGYFCENKHGRRQDARNGSGAAFDRDQAMWASFGEALERYAAFIPDRSTFTMATQDALGQSAVALRDFIAFSDRQYLDGEVPFARPDPALPRNWVPALDLHTRRTSWVPAVAVYLGLRIDHENENILQNTSSGLSCGPSPEAAMLGGLCEVIERDAFASMWQTMVRPTLLCVDDAHRGRLHRGVRRALDNTRVPISLWSITADTGLPVVMACADSIHDGRIAFGACANPDPVRAVNKAIVEALHGLVWSNRVRHRGRPLPTRDEIVSPSDHFAHYLDPAMRPCLAFLFDEASSMPLSALVQAHPVQMLDETVAHLDRLGKRVLSVDVTTPDVADLGLHVYRTLVPGLQPLLFGGRLVSHDDRRLRELARYWGIGGAPACNPAPHPFP